MSDIVWLLWFEQEREDGEDTELLIGVYRTEEAARAAFVARVTGSGPRPISGPAG